MSVRDGLLAVLAQGACYGYQLKAEFERRTGAGRRVNVGQVYSTLERLERDGLVLRSDADPDGRAFFAITPAGRIRVAEWLDTPVTSGDLDETARKIALALTLDDVDPARMLDTQRAANADALRTARDAQRRLAAPNRADGFAALIAADARVAALEAEAAWLAQLGVRLAELPGGAALPPVPIAGDAPRRGRPPKPRSTAA